MEGGGVRCQVFGESELQRIWVSGLEFASEGRWGRLWFFYIQ